MADGLYAQIHEAAKAALEGLDLSDLFPGQSVSVYKQYFADRTDIAPPAILLTIENQQEEPGPFTDSLHDSYKYPVLILIVDKAPVRAQDKAKYMTARQRIRELFRGRLATVPECSDCEISFQFVLNQDVPIFEDVQSGLLVKFISSEPRV